MSNLLEVDVDGGLICGMFIYALQPITVTCGSRPGYDRTRYVRPCSNDRPRYVHPSYVHPIYGSAMLYYGTTMVYHGITTAYHGGTMLYYDGNTMVMSE